MRQRNVVIGSAVAGLVLAVVIAQYSTIQQPPLRRQIVRKAEPVAESPKANPALESLEAEQKTIFDKAEAAYRAKDYDISIKLFDELLKHCTNASYCEKAKQLRCYALMSHGDLQGAAAGFKSLAFESTNETVRLDALTRYSYLCLKLKDDPAAREAFNRLAVSSPDKAVQADALLRSSYISLRDDKMTSAQKAALFAKIVEDYPDSKEAQQAALRHARLISSMPDQPLDARRTAFQKVVDQYPGTKQAQEAQISLASVEWRESEINPSVEKKQEVEQLYRTLQSSAATAAERGNATMNIAALNLEIERLQHAADSDHAIDYDKVISLCDDALAVPDAKPVDLATAALMRAESLHYSGKLSDADQAFTELMQKFQTDPTCATQVAFASYMKAMNYLQQKDTTNALRAFETVSTQYADVPNFAGNNIAASSLTWIANLSMQSGDFGRAGQAIALLENSYANTPDAAQLETLKSLLEIKRKGK